MSILKLKPVYLSEDYEKYDFEWQIPNWEKIRGDESIVTTQRLIFETEGDPLLFLKTRWVIGLKAVTRDGTKFARLFWQLLDISGIGISKEQKITATVKSELVAANDDLEYIEPRKEIVGLGDIIEEVTYWDHDIEICQTFQFTDIDLIADFSGALRYKLELTIDRPPISLWSGCLKMHKFLKSSAGSLSKDMTAMLEDGSNSDIKIVTSDDVEFSAHKLILQARCPVFAGMFNADLLENTNGVVRTTDICGKTMKILLNYFYSGELLSNWRDDDIIVEFTYAAGKYQMSQVLELLDGLLGVFHGTNTDSTCIDVQLLNLARKLSLENAEKRLLRRVLEKIKNIKESDELFLIFGIDKNVILEKAKEKLLMRDILKIWSYASGNFDNENTFKSNALLVIALVNKDASLKNVEMDLLKLFSEITSNVTTSNQLFDLIDKY